MRDGRRSGRSHIYPQDAITSMPAREKSRTLRVAARPCKGGDPSNRPDSIGNWPLSQAVR